MAEYEVGNSVDIIFPQNNPNLMKIMPKTMVSTSTGGGGEGTNDHRQLTNRNATNQHPIGAISGLQSALDSKQSSEIEDVDGYFSIDTVEGALKELGAYMSGGDSAQIFVAEYGVTSYQDIINAYNSNKICLCKREYANVGFRVGYLTEGVSSYGTLYFISNKSNGRTLAFAVDDDDHWGDEWIDYYQPQTITDEGGYFTTDTVEGALQELGANMSGGTFIAQYGITPHEDILNAYDSGKSCICVRIFAHGIVRVGYLNEITSTPDRILFTTYSSDGAISFWFVDANNEWSSSDNSYYQSSAIVDYNQYFTTDTVEGALDELGAAKLSPINKTNTMTLSVGRDASGQLWTEDKTDVFNVEYGTTLYNDIVNAYNSGKICVMQINGRPYFLTKLLDRTVYFVWNTNDTDRRVVTLNRSGNVYSEETSSPIIAKSSLVQAIDESVSTNIDNPPTTKAVYDALEIVEGLISDIQTDKQDKLTAGDNITIVDNVISSTGGSGSDNVFNVTYGVTPIADIVAANSDKKICRMEYNNTVFYLTGIFSNSATFSSLNSPRVLKVDLNGTTWSRAVDVAMQTQTIKDREEYFSTDTVEGALKELYDALHSLNIDSINGLRNEFGMIADTFEGMAEDINAKISCTDAQVGSYGYIKLSDLPIYDGGVV